MRYIQRINTNHMDPLGTCDLKAVIYSMFNQVFSPHTSLFFTIPFVVTTQIFSHGWTSKEFVPSDSGSVWINICIKEKLYKFLGNKFYAKFYSIFLNDSSTHQVQVKVVQWPENTGGFLMPTFALLPHGLYGEHSSGWQTLLWAPSGALPQCRGSEHFYFVDQ